MEWMVLSVLVLVGLVRYAYWRNAKYGGWLREIGVAGSEAVEYYDWSEPRFKINAPGDDAGQWRNGLLLITHKRIAIYTYPEPQPQFTIQPNELRGFWRPQKYTDGTNEMWIHAQIGLTWHILKIRLRKFHMQKHVRAMKRFATDEQTTAYRRRRPYIHRGPAPAHPATQNLQGAWELEAPVNLYIMPLHLVIFVDEEVHRVLNLTTIQDIAALKRLEGGNPAGLVRFTAEEEALAFAMDDYEAWAADLAEAAKRTLEEPMTRKRKGKDDDEEEF